MEEFCRREPSLLLPITVMCTNNPLPSPTVTQIPLECSRNPDVPIVSSRPPWVRPVRKKTPSSARSPAGSGGSPSHHGSPEDFATSDAFLDLNGGQSPRPATTSGYSPPPPNPSSQGVAQVLSQNPYAGTGSAGGGAPSFLEPAGAGLDALISGPGDTGASALAMSPQEIMALFGEGSVDMTSLLMSPETGGGNGNGGGFYGASMVSP